MLRELLGTKASQHTVNLIGFVVEQGRARELTQIIDSLVELAAKERQKAVAEVRTAGLRAESARAASSNGSARGSPCG